MRNVATYRCPQENATRLIQIYYGNIDSHALNTICLPHNNATACCTVWQETKLNHEFSINTDSLNCSLFPRSIQCERTSFLASFDSSIGKKNISHLVAEGQMFKEQGEMAVFTGYVLMCYSFFEHSKRIFYGDSIKFQNQYL